MRVGILTSGGDCQALNATMRGLVKALYQQRKDIEIIGFLKGYQGLMYEKYKKMSLSDFEDILNVGGTILGSSRCPFKKMRVIEDGFDKVEAMKKTYKKLKLDCLVVLGGNGSLKSANMLSQEGLNVIGLPKTIDNDTWGTDYTFGFQSAVDIATNYLNEIETTAKSHSRVFVVEIMGHKVGHICLQAGIAAGVDAILLPEIPYDIKVIARFSFLPFITALIQITVDHLLIFNLGLTYSIFIVYNYFQQNLISLDPLTKINNREQLDIYLTMKMKDNHQKKDLYLFLLDIDQFKKINDELGHVVGDQIILKIADILKQIAHLHNCFISRYGGDEFIMVCERDKNVEITPIFNDLQRLFQQSYEGLPDFSVSIGYVKYDESLNYIPKFIEKADHYMYLNKNVKK